MSKMTDELKQRVLESLENSMEQVFAGGLRVEAVRIDRYRVVIQLFVTDDKGRTIVDLGSAELAEGDTLTVTGIREALKISLK